MYAENQNVKDNVLIQHFKKATIIDFTHYGSFDAQGRRSLVPWDLERGNTVAMQKALEDNDLHKLVHEESKHNIICNVGKAGVAGLTGNTGSIAAFTYIALGSSGTAVSAADTILGSELTTNGMGRASATVSRVTTTTTNDTLQLYNLFTASGTVASIQESGIFNNNTANSGLLLAHVTFTSVGLSATDTIAITWQYVLS